MPFPFKQEPSFWSGPIITENQSRVQHSLVQAIMDGKHRQVARLLGLTPSLSFDTSVVLTKGLDGHLFIETTYCVQWRRGLALQTRKHYSSVMEVALLVFEPNAAIVKQLLVAGAPTNACVIERAVQLLERFHSDQLKPARGFAPQRTPRIQGIRNAISIIKHLDNSRVDWGVEVDWHRFGFPSSSRHAYTVIQELLQAHGEPVIRLRKPSMETQKTKMEKTFPVITSLVKKLPSFPSKQ